MKRRVHFGQEKQKVHRCDVVLEIAESVTTGLMFSICLMIVWGGEPSIHKLVHLAFSASMVIIIMLSILKPLSVVKRYKIEDLVWTLCTIFQAIAIGLVIGHCHKEAFVPILSINLLSTTSKLPKNLVVCRIVAAVVIGIFFNLRIIGKIAAGIAVFDTIFYVLHSLNDRVKLTRKNSSNHLS